VEIGLRELNALRAPVSAGAVHAEDHRLLNESRGIDRMKTDATPKHSALAFLHEEPQIGLSSGGRGISPPHWPHAALVMVKVL